MPHMEQAFSKYNNNVNTILRVADTDLNNLVFVIPSL